MNPDWPLQPLQPTDEWGVLGPTSCPICQGLRRDKGFAFTLVAVGLLSLWVLDRMGR